MNKPPLISIITATYNAELLLEKTINSILSQKYTAIEYIIIDGGSKDGTLSIIEKYKHIISYYISEPDAGIYDAWNKGVAIASGEWVSFLGAGDEYLPDALDNYVKFIQSSDAHTADFVSSRVDVVNSEGLTLYTLGTEWEWPKFLDYMNIAHVGSLHSTRFFNKYGIYNPKYKVVGDYELLLRAGPDMNALFLPTVTAKMLFGGLSISKVSLKEAFMVKLASGYSSPVKIYLKYYFSLFKASVRFFLFKKGIFISIRK
jgi:glycosyltransferase involved in cell wall biosynthesis